MLKFKNNLINISICLCIILFIIIFIIIALYFVKYDYNLNNNSEQFTNTIIQNGITYTIGDISNDKRVTSTPQFYFFNDSTITSSTSDNGWLTSERSPFVTMNLDTNTTVYGVVIGCRAGFPTQYVSSFSVQYTDLINTNGNSIPVDNGKIYQGIQDDLGNLLFVYFDTPVNANSITINPKYTTVINPSTAMVADIILGPSNPTTTFPTTTIPTTTFPTTTIPTTTIPTTTIPTTTIPTTTIPTTTLPTTTLPTTTLSSNTTNPSTTNNPSSTLSSNTTNPSTTNPIDNRIDSSSTNLYQKNFDGTSNVYAPYLYYNMEEFAPLNLYDDKYSVY